MKHKTLECEGCGKVFKKMSMIWFFGHYLCPHCKIRRNMPLVGYKNKEAWKKHESKLINKKRDIPYLTYNERSYLYKHYTALGMSYPDIKARYRIINWQLVRTWNKRNVKENQRGKDVQEV